MKEFVLERDGKRPLRFVGCELARSACRMGERHSHPTEQGRQRASLYQTKGGYYVLEIVRTFETPWDGDDPSVANVESFSDLESAIEFAEELCSWASEILALAPTHLE